MVFLFQTGAIKTKTFNLIVGNSHFSFYSKLVRLKHQPGHVVKLPLISFYSKLVRLKRGAWRTSIKLPTFLFQTGAIKTSSICFFLEGMCEFLFQTGAIKTVQRLKQYHYQRMFLFQTGAIKTFAIPKNNIVLFRKFLFQTGAIKTIRIRSMFQSWQVSIPNWCD